VELELVGGLKAGAGLLYGNIENRT